MNKKPINPTAAQVQCMQGKPLPPDWQAKAKQRAAMANAGYLHDLENAWRSKETSADSANIMRAARLSANAPSWNDLLGSK